MINEIFGNNFFKETFKSMLSSGRLPHGFILYGETGTGKKTIAHYMAKTLLCEKGGTEPCNNCRSCRNIDKGIHPDLIFPERSGKLMTYSIDTCRKICSESIIVPNNNNRKIYMFNDADRIQIPAQNSLLKLIEEPPDFVYFIFTASSKDVFLPTIISRVVSIGVSPCSNEECRNALMQKNYTDEQINNALSIFGGNIGMCIKLIEDEKLQEIALLTKKAANSIIKKDEYELLTVLSSAMLKERTDAVVFFKMLGDVIRDAVVTNVNPSVNCIGSCKNEAQALGKRLSFTSAEKICSAISKASEDYKANVNTSLIMSGLCGEIMNS